MECEGGIRPIPFGTSDTIHLQVLFSGKALTPPSTTCENGFYRKCEQLGTLDFLVSVQWVNQSQRAAAVPLNANLKLLLHQSKVGYNSFTPRRDGMRVISHVHEANAIAYYHIWISWGVLLYHAVIIAQLDVLGNRYFGLRRTSRTILPVAGSRNSREMPGPSNILANSFPASSHG